jgi:hypothetical protein
MLFKSKCEKTKYKFIENKHSTINDKKIWNWGESTMYSPESKQWGWNSNKSKVRTRGSSLALQWGEGPLNKMLPTLITPIQRWWKITHTSYKNRGRKSSFVPIWLFEGDNSIHQNLGMIRVICIFIKMALQGTLFIELLWGKTKLLSNVKIGNVFITPNGFRWWKRDKPCDLVLSTISLVNHGRWI